jgi:hypothetical protein
MAAVVMRLREEEVHTDFVRAGATIPANAKSLADIGLHESGAVRRLIRHAVVREAAPGVYYFDEEVYEAIRATRRRMAIILLVTMLGIAAVLAFGMTTLR